MSRIATAQQKLEVGERLAAMRTGTGLSQAAFAETLGISVRAYLNYERGEREMPVAVFRALHDVYGVDLTWLLVGPEPAPVKALARRLDLDLLQEIIRVIEESLRRAGKTLKPEKKTRLIRLAYERCMLLGEIDAANIRAMLALAA